MSHINIPRSLSHIEFTPGDGYTRLLLTTNIQVKTFGDKHISSVASEAGHPPVIYSDYLKEGEKVRLGDYLEGSIRDDFDFGPVVWVETALLEAILAKGVPDYRFAGWYDLRLRLSEYGLPYHVAEPLYEVSETGKNVAGEEAHFAYVDPKNRDVQIEMEQAATYYLSRTETLVDTSALPDASSEGEFSVEASVIIPVRNRARTIADAVHSALSQKTDFPYNVIVVDNLSSDGTSEILSEIASADPRLVVIDTSLFPGRTFRIGGCWNLAINSEHCGRYAIQLDSDDVYEDSDVISRIVAKFRERNYGMVIGSYRLTDIDMNPLPPGLIDHREWTDSNGPNNALRINGLGAPRAFMTAVVRQIGFPNVSYGEDYAVGLAVSRSYRIGRIFDSLYLCRRWEDNTDYALSPEKVIANNLFKDSVRTAEINARKLLKREALRKNIDKFFTSQLNCWKLASDNFMLQNRAFTESEKITLPDYPDVKVMKILAPHRRRSAIADVTLKAIRERGCFLCKESRPAEQNSIISGDYEILVNPYPVTPDHLTIPARNHTPQLIAGRFADMVRFAGILQGQVVFYNGGKCGASAPDHFHFQAVSLPDELMFSVADGVEFASSDLVPYISIGGIEASEIASLAERIFSRLPHKDGEEPMVNVAVTFDGAKFSMKIFLRRAHRPRCFGEGPGRLSISPASVEMMGLFVTSSQEDFDAMTPEKVVEIYRDVCMTPQDFESLKDTLKNEF